MFTQHIGKTYPAFKPGSLDQALPRRCCHVWASHFRAWRVGIKTARKKTTDLSLRGLALSLPAWLTIRIAKNYTLDETARRLTLNATPEFVLLGSQACTLE